MENNNQYKWFNLPDNLSVRVDMLRKGTVTYIDCFSDIKSFSGYKPMLVYGYVYLTENVKEFGEGFSLNVKELLDGNYLIDGAGYRHSANWSMYPPKFLNKLNETKKLITDTTQTFVGDETYCKSFGSGKLTLVCDNKGNYTKIKYTSKIINEGGTEKYIYPVSEVEDGNVYARKAGSYVTNGRNIYTFSYNDDGKLTGISESRSGKSVTFEYTTDSKTGEVILAKIKCSDGRTLTLTNDDYSNINITSPDGYIHKITGNDTSAQIITQSTQTEIPNGTNSTTLPPIINWQITFGDAVKIADVDGNCEYYKFNEDGEISEYCKEANGVVTYAERWVYQQTEGSRLRYEHKYTALEYMLYKTPYANFNFFSGSAYDEHISRSYDEKNRLVSEESNNKLLSLCGYNGSYMDYYKTITYNDNNTLKQEKTKYTFYDLDDDGEVNHMYYNHITDYEYDSDNRLKKRSSYVDEQKETKGMEVVEYVYDGYDRIIKTVSYNSLDNTNVFIKEVSYDDYGRVLTETDGTGLKNLTYGYDNITDELKTVTFANGNSVSYGYTNGQLASVTAAQSTNTVTYAKGEVTKLSDSQNAIGFSYDNQRRLSEVSIDSVKQYDVTYNTPEPDKLFVGPLSVKMENAKGESFTCEEDTAQTYTEIKYGDTTELKTTYLANGFISTETDGVTGETVQYTYDGAKNIRNYKVQENGKETYQAYFIQTGHGDISGIGQSGVSNITYNYMYDDGINGKLTRIVVDNERINVNSDNLGRYTGRSITNSGTDILTESIEYKSTSEKYNNRTVNRQSNLPSKITYNDSSKLEYIYDDSGNITKVVDNNGKQIRYTYDSLDRLIREDNQPFNKSYTFTYDTKGNIQSKTEYVYSTGSLTNSLSETSFLYTNGKLTKFGSSEITYDAIGNPTTYKGKTLTWTKGKRLTAYGDNTFEYDGRGRRIKKNGVRYYYDYEDKLIASGDGIQFFYDNIGVAGFKYNGATYTYKRDIQNNVTGILDNTGNQVVQYDYDAWGNHTVSGSNTELGNKNPFRYRSYFYDTETGLYFLKTRYYDPAIGRFLSPDSFQYADPETVNGLNLYAYCCNNPVNYCDPTGHFLISALALIIAGIVAGGVVNGLIAGANAAEGESFGSAFLGGFISGVFSGIGLAVGLATGGIGGALIAGIFGFAGGFLGSMTTQAISYGDIDYNVATIAGAIGAGSNLMLYVGLRVSGIYSSAPTFLARVAENLKIGMIPLAMSIFISSLPMFNPNQFRGLLD